VRELMLANEPVPCSILCARTSRAGLSAAAGVSGDSLIAAGDRWPLRAGHLQIRIEIDGIEGAGPRLRCAAGADRIGLLASAAAPGFHDAAIPMFLAP